MSYAPPPPVAGPQPLRPDEERTWSLLAHLGGIIFGFIPALVIWLVFKGRGQYLEDQAKEALNFQITVAIASVVGFILSFVTFGLSSLAVWTASVVFAILAAVAVNKGEWYRYPVTLRLVK